MKKYVGPTNSCFSFHPVVTDFGIGICCFRRSRALLVWDRPPPMKGILFCLVKMDEVTHGEKALCSSSLIVIFITVVFILVCFSF